MPPRTPPRLLDALDRRLREALATTEESPDVLQLLIHELGEYRSVASMIRCILCNPDRLHQIAESSYIHPNGYDKIPLISRNTAQVPYELRMHIWWANSERKTMDIHNHDWDFASRVLCGQLYCEEFEESAQGKPIHRYSYIRSAKGRFELQYKGMGYLTTTRAYTILPNQSYHMQWSTLHRAFGITGRTTATILIQGPTRSLSSTVYRESILDNTRDDILRIKSLEASALAEKLEKLLDALALASS